MQAPNGRHVLTYAHVFIATFDGRKDNDPPLAVEWGEKSNTSTRPPVEHKRTLEKTYCNGATNSHTRFMHVDASRPLNLRRSYCCQSRGRVTQARATYGPPTFRVAGIK